MTTETIIKTSLYDQLGGSTALETVVELFYLKVLSDPMLELFFRYSDMERLKKRQIAFLAQVLGGPAIYKGRDMKKAHAKLSIKPFHFERVAMHLVATLKMLGTPLNLIDQVIELIAPLADEIVTTV